MTFFRKAQKIDELSPIWSPAIGLRIAISHWKSYVVMLVIFGVAAREALLEYDIRGFHYVTVKYALFAALMVGLIISRWWEDNKV